MRFWGWVIAGGTLATACGNFGGTTTGADTPDGGQDAAPVVGGGGVDSGDADDASPLADGGAPDSATDSGGPVDAGPPIESGAAPPPPTEPTNGIYVSASMGSDGNTGAMSAPFQTITAAIAAAQLASLPVLACAETYSEALTLVNGVSIYGNYDCTQATWPATAATNAQLVAPTSPAVTANSITAKTIVSHLDIVAPAATATTQPSSIGIFASNTTALTLASLTVTAADALDGTAGTNPTPLTDEIAGSTNSCGEPSGPLQGGPGGSAGSTATWQCHAPDWELKTAGSAGGAGSYPPGAPVTPMNGMSSNGGLFRSSGWVTGDGTAGTNGSGGKGGNGTAAPMPDGPCAGTGTTTTEGKPGQPGGCPGLAGGPGTGGGSSVAILTYSSPLLLSAITINTGKGGTGGAGTYGTEPTVGASSGGAPGISGSGAGGDSIGVAYTGNAVIDVSGVTFATIGPVGVGVSAFSDPSDATRTVPTSSSGVRANATQIVFTP